MFSDLEKGAVTAAKKLGTETAKTVEHKCVHMCVRCVCIHACMHTYMCVCVVCVRACVRALFVCTVCVSL